MESSSSVFLIENGKSVLKKKLKVKSNENLKVKSKNLVTKQIFSFVIRFLVK